MSYKGKQLCIFILHTHTDTHNHTHTHTRQSGLMLVALYSCFYIRVVQLSSNVQLGLKSAVGLSIYLSFGLSISVCLSDLSIYLSSFHVY